MAKRRKKSEIKAFHEMIEERYRQRREAKKQAAATRVEKPRPVSSPTNRRIIKPAPKPKSQKNGYFLTKSGKFVHREVYKETYGQIPHGWVVHHIDQCKTNNDPENLIAMPRLVHDRLHDLMRRTGNNWNKKRQFEFLQRRFDVLKLEPTRPWNLELQTSAIGPPSRFFRIHLLR